MLSLNNTGILQVSKQISTWEHSAKKKKEQGDILHTVLSP